ncbi:transcriptional regulator, TetR family [Catenulispora acidiphila DSM 44928]|uniref:Transcriptional regulator, TetR family n=1 Tax=Catenulispora acidiphila (strain DSM 44928 / JCM 14897 / NBRC 102108 / NRRL B-24433 / ID139908) TaxID=479433 RepID=C7Q0G9_CATAD|nr:TetR/AcrR family transcriptional regulator [Catenulispora acidiphila]ACU77502.1 transcriptional regulator, TetR family [Catenulispora acidiphila DSM 44928]
MSSARARVLETATLLFYTEGIHTVGVDRVIADAKVAKATFYHHFKSKEELVLAYLTAEYGRQRDVFSGVPGVGLERIEAILDKLAEVSVGPGFRGCPFLNAAAEFADPGHPVRHLVDDYRAWYRDLMRDILTTADRPDADHKADLLLLVRDGIAVAGGLGDKNAVEAGVRTALSAL